MIDVFEIGVSLTMANGVSSVLSTIQKDLLGMSHSINDVEKGFGRMHAAVLGLTGVMAGAGLLGAMWKVADAGREQISIEERLLTAGMKRAEIEQMTAKAWDLAQTKRDQSSTQYLEMLAEMRNALPDTNEVLKVAPLAADFMTDIKMGHPDADSGGMLQDALKTISLRHRLYHPGTRDLDEAGIQDELDWQGRATRFTNGQQNPHTFRQMASQAGPAAAGMSSEAFYGFGAEVANTLQASKAGTAMSSLFQQLIGGTMPKWVAENLIQGGILDKNKVHFANGHANLDAGAVHDEKGMIDNPFTWLNSTISDYAKAHHITAQQASYKILGRATTQRLGSDAVGNIGELQGAFEKQKQAWGIRDTANEARQNDPANLMRQVAAGWEDLQVALGKSMWLPGGTFYTAAHELIDGLRALTGWAIKPENAETIATIMKWTGALGAFLVVGGGLTVAATAFAAMVPIMLPLGLAAGLVYAAFRLLGTAGMQKLGQDLIGFATGVGNVARDFGAQVAPYLVGIGSVFSDFMTNLRPIATGIANVCKDFYSSLDTVVHNLDLSFKGIVKLMDDFVSAIKNVAGEIGEGIKGLATGVASGVGHAASDGYHGLQHLLGLGNGPTGAPAALPSPGQLSGSPFVPSAGGTTLTVQSNLNVNGEVLASVVNQVNGRTASLPDSSGSGFNTRGSMPSPLGAN